LGLDLGAAQPAKGFEAEGKGIEKGEKGGGVGEEGHAHVFAL